MNSRYAFELEQELNRRDDQLRREGKPVPGRTAPDAAPSSEVATLRNALLDRIVRDHGGRLPTMAAASYVYQLDELIEAAATQATKKIAALEDALRVKSSAFHAEADYREPHRGHAWINCPATTCEHDRALTATEGSK